MSNERQTGTVKWFDAKKGFGFIRNDIGGGDVFAHHSQINQDGYRSLEEGDNVSFYVENSPKGLKAIEILKTN